MPLAFGNDINSGQLLERDDEVVLSGRREFSIGEEDWIGPEVVDPELLDKNNNCRTCGNTRGGDCYTG